MSGSALFPGVLLWWGFCHAFLRACAERERHGPMCPGGRWIWSPPGVARFPEFAGRHPLQRFEPVRKIAHIVVSHAGTDLRHGQRGCFQQKFRFVDPQPGNVGPEADAGFTAVKASEIVFAQPYKICCLFQRKGGIRVVLKREGVCLPNDGAVAGVILLLPDSIQQPFRGGKRAAAQLLRVFAGEEQFGVDVPVRFFAEKADLPDLALKPEHQITAQAFQALGADETRGGFAEQGAEKAVQRLCFRFLKQAEYKGVGFGLRKLRFPLLAIEKHA